MNKETITINTEFIAMDKLLKFSGIADTGGQAFLMIEDSIVYLNGQLVTEKRKKVYAGDTVTVNNELELVIEREA